VKLFTLLQALDTLQTNAVSLDSTVEGVHNDTRAMKPGDLFVAISGSEADGHKYINEAVKLGASIIVSEQPLSQSIPHVVVPDSRAALARLAACMAGYPAEKLIMTGVTGTKGKTTVTHIVKGLIEGVTGKKAGLIGTIHTERTTPDAVALNRLFADMVSQGCTYCVMETSSHALDQSRVAGIQFKAGAFTNLHQDHLDYHKTMENYFAAKSRLFLQSDKAIINIDCEYGKRLYEQYPEALTVSKKLMQNLKLNTNEISFQLSTHNSQLATIKWLTPGQFTVYNVLTAIKIGEALGLPLEEMARVMPEIPPVKGRMERVPLEKDFHVYIDYAHTPDAIAAALQTARSFTKGRLLALFGCGGDRDKIKRPVMGAAAVKYADLCYVTSDNPRSEDPEEIIRNILAGISPQGVVVEPDRKKAIQMVLAEAKPGDVVMLLGKGHEVTQEIKGEKLPFDEREIVREALA
jgi:UDP-N-acetylmuramoyl-L-alanyl-D-glutamate--2,6-diaminopimelate ligase